MATATKHSRAAGQLARNQPDVRVPDSMQFTIFENNRGAHHWRILADDGATLAQSGSFASHQDAEQAAQRVRDGAATARLDRATEAPVDLAARRNERSDDLDAERWLHDSGTFSSGQWRDG